MQNQHHIQLQQHMQQGFQPHPTSSQPEEQQIQYGRSMEALCKCQNIMNERDQERCVTCKHDHFKLQVLLNELNSQGNPVTNEVHIDYDQIPLDMQLYINNPIMNQQPPLSPLVREHVREPPPPNTIWFYNRNEPYYEFTNFKEGFPIKAAIREPYPGSPPDIKVWATSEHLFQAAKFKKTNPEIADKIRRCRTARDALNMARKFQQYVDPSWQSINVQVMEWVVKNKFEQHPKLAQRLLETGDQKLVEHTEVDRFWGDGGDGSGRNMLGEVLMRVRKHLRDNQSHLKSNNGEDSIYSMSGPASSSTSSLQARHGQGSSSQQSQIPPSPPPLPPRRLERRDIQQYQQHIQQHIQQQQQQQHRVSHIQQQHQQQEPLYYYTSDVSTYPPPYSEHPNM